MCEFDVAIAGSGPGGTAAAIALAQQGFRVAIAEAEPFPRPHPGETLHPGIEPLLQQLGVGSRLLAAGFLRHTGNWIQWESSPRFEPFGSDETGPWQGFQAWRADFDTMLRDRAIELRVEVRQPCRALHPIVSQNRVTGIATNQGEIKAKFAVDATGSRQWLAKPLKLAINPFSPPLIAHYGYVEGDCPIRDDAPAIVANDSGWIWTAKVRPQLYQWTRLDFGNQRIEKNWQPAEFQTLKPWGKPAVADVTWRQVSPPAGPGYFLVGDAATVLDPASSHGVLKAVMSGMMTAHLITQLLQGKAFESQVIAGYSQWMETWFQKDIQTLKNLYALLPNAPDWVR
ncbi:FAD-dependent monooxygenase [Phormidium pseudopriestleyi FRX01]|uniref:FAD-dependent monooxygenase n=1 Tax=Phormidium pseudopriestleyi FRX01 TaxID=1759528 RepID=A0ABS3FVM1_9CYAN|nr:NAD(P)/FAD-dependent oxidoreductase [Phormidium pseudopriestleyi]MBO0351103.1 FAD-dependent monooxygenase [Phormidium pseudopriestleyi FRX01]